MNNIYDPVESDLEAFRNTYIMSPELWDKFNIDDLHGIEFEKWGKLKLIGDDGLFSKGLNAISTKYGGIYIYCIESGIIPDCGSYIMYVGMASKTASENLKARIKSYQKEVGDGYSRDRLHRLFSKWGKYVYVHYLTIDADCDTILTLEDRLIATLIPPCNADIRIESVKHAVRAFD